MLDALEQALQQRRPFAGGGLIHHSDKGSQYVSIRYTERLALAGIEPSVGSVGDSYDTRLHRNEVLLADQGRDFDNLRAKPRRDSATS